LTQCTKQALQGGALQSLSTAAEFVEQDGIHFLVRQLANLARKEVDKSGAKPSHNPFLPYEQDLYVGDVSDTHVCLLNKFNVVDHHLLVVTRMFEDQETALNQQDFEALWYCLLEYDGLGFYNAGQTAGASQRHKHLQVVPLPMASQGSRIPIEPRLLEDARRGVHSLPYQYRFMRLPALRSPREAAAATLNRYRAMLREFGLLRESDATGPYNLLITREWLLLVPRVQESVEGIPINALGFAGALLVKNDRQWALLKQQGPLTVLSRVARSTHNT
jgi:ATP adenylyltransferase